MTTRKVAISVPEETLRRAKLHAKAIRSRGLSAYVSEALAEKVMTDDLSALFEEILAESGGPATRREIERADRALHVGVEVRAVAKKKRRAA
jgi:hypothetical protein